MRYGGDLYNEAANRATFVVSLTGNVLSRPPDLIDENDKIIVRIAGPPEELAKLIIQRKSAFNDVGSYRILGEGTNPDKFQRYANHATECTELVVELANFAPGRGQVQLARLDASGASVPFSEFDFAVHSLYRGAFSFGPVYSWLNDRSFGTATQVSGATPPVTTNVVTITEQSPQVRYVVSYTHYIWGRVDEEKANVAAADRVVLKEARPFYKYLYPTFGLSLQNNLKNVFAGLTYDIGGTNIYLTAGAHIGRVTVLDPTANLGVGSVLPGGYGSVPTRTETNADWFVGLSLDLRAATKFLGLFGTGAAASR